MMMRFLRRRGGKRRGGKRIPTVPTVPTDSEVLAGVAVELDGIRGRLLRIHDEGEADDVGHLLRCLLTAHILPGIDLARQASLLCLWRTADRTRSPVERIGAS